MISEDGFRIGRNMAYLSIRLVTSFVTSMISVRIVLRALGVDHYGAYAAVLGVVGFFGAVSGMLENAARRFLSHEMSLAGRGDVSRMFSALFVLVGTVTLFVLVVGETAGMWFVRNVLSVPESVSDVVGTVFRLFLANIAFGLMQIPFVAQITAGERMSFFAKFGFLEALLVMVSSFAAYAGIEVYSAAVLMSGAIEFAVCAVCCFRMFPGLRFKPVSWREDIPSVGAFVSWSTLGTLGNLLKYQGSAILLNMYAGAPFSASWKIAISVWGLLWGVCGNFKQAFSPTVFKAWEGRSSAGFMHITGAAVLVSFVLAAVPAAAIFLLTDEFLLLWLGGNTAPQLAAFVKCSLVNLVFDAVSSPLTTAIDATGKVARYQIVTSSLSLAAFLCCWMVLCCGFPEWMTMAGVALCNGLACVYRFFHLRGLLAGRG